MSELRSYRRDPELVVYEAEEPGDVLRIRREVEGRAWATRHGIPTAETVAKDAADRWLVSRRVHEDPAESAQYVAAALEMSHRIQRLPHPRFTTRGATWRAPRRTVPTRVARLVRAGIDPRTLTAARTAFEALPHDVTSHNDYHRANVLNTSAAGHVTVIDWEFTAVGPRHQDFVRLVVDLQEAETAHAAWRLLVDSVAARQRPALGVQLRWLALRTYATEVTVPPRELDPTKAARRRARWLDARRWAAGLVPDPQEIR
ncbi:phosphotransferase [Nocardioides sp. SYSU DS0651]|uniref:phosphotransferase n=1 Tax=Nocardioides sp. SYSU DS0651 TaxID=3415955 RepID=UPI003F4BAF57